VDLFIYSLPQRFIRLSLMLIKIESDIRISYGKKFCCIHACQILKHIRYCYSFVVLFLRQNRLFIVYRENSDLKNQFFNYRLLRHFYDFMKKVTGMVLITMRKLAFKLKPHRKTGRVLVYKIRYSNGPNIYKDTKP
jgi:hypothetical protein